MKLAIQYLSDISGKTQAIQLPLSDWEKVLARLNKYEQSFKIKTDLKDAFDEITKTKKSKVKKQNLTDFLNEL